MVKEATFIPPGTFVDSSNWEELKQKGMAHCTNVFDYSDYGLVFTGDEAARASDILKWEVGEANVFEGWVCIEGKPVEPEPYRDDIGYYIVPPDENWTNPWSRMLDSEHPEIKAEGISNLIEPDLDDPASFMSMKPCWDIWIVYRTTDKFRCMGPTGEKFEGALHEVIDYIKSCEYGKDH
jgi:hypothetical protein